MKKFRMFLMLLLVAIVLVPGCKDDDDDKTPSNHMTIADNNYELSQAVIMSYGLYSGTGFTELLLLSPGLVLNEVNGIFSITGVGHGISFEIFTATDEMLSSDVYTYDVDETENPGTFYIESAVVGRNTVTGDGTYYDVTGGKLTVEKSETTYTFSFEGAASNNVNITASFKGVPVIYDFSDELKSAKASHRIFL
ncbi:MAG TPA: hypothetical protein VFC92_14670 [Bacteroidales bacterium]|nr:hypothetical protein [Bacteroidales bacterium]